MTALVLHRNPLGPFPLDRWLADLPGGVVMLAARDRIEAAGEQVPDRAPGYRHFEVLDDFGDERATLGRARDLARRHRVSQVLALHEGDIGRAAALREELGLGGQSPAAVLPFRDKVLMKQRVSAYGIEVAPHAVCRSAGAVRAFAARHGLPVVLKERDGFGSVGLMVVRSAEELDHRLARLADDPGPERLAAHGLLAEAFVPGRMCHVDGLVRDGRVALCWPSQYQYDLASFATDHGPRIDLSLDADDPLTGRLVRLAEQAVAALQDGAAPADYAFHAEVFHTPDDRLVFCETACRPGGARIRDVFRALFGVDLAEYAVRAQAGLPVPDLAPVRAAGPRRMAGQMVMMKRPGTVRAVPAPATESWLEFWDVFVRPGQRVTAAARSSDLLAAAVASAPTRSETEQRLRTLGRRLAREIDIRPA